MNRMILSLFSLATILFLFGGIVAAEEGSTTAVDSSMEKKTDAMKPAQMTKKVFKVESNGDALAHAMKRVDIANPSMRLETRLEIKEELPTNLDEEVKKALVRFNIDDATLARIRALSTSEQEKAWEEIRARYRAAGDPTEYELRLKTHEDHVKDVLAAHKLEGDARFLARLRIAHELAERLGNEALKEKLSALRQRLANKTTLSTTDVADIDSAILEHRMEDFKEKVPHVLETAARINTRLTTFISRLENKIEEQKAAGKNTARLEAGLNKLTNLQARLETQLEEAKGNWETFSSDPSKDTLKAVHHDLVQLKVLAKHAVHDMHVLVRWYKHFHDHDGEIEIEATEAYDGALVDEMELEAVVELEAEAEANAVVGEVVETEDSGMDSADDAAENETDDAATDAAIEVDIEVNATGGTA